MVDDRFAAGGFPSPTQRCGVEGDRASGAGEDGAHGTSVGAGGGDGVRVVRRGHRVGAGGAGGHRHRDRPGRRQPAGVAITPDGAHAYVTNFNAATVSVISIDTAPTISGTPPQAVAGNPFTFTVTPTPTVSVTAGTLPPGLSLTTDGTLTGTPTTAGTYPITLTATNGITPRRNPEHLDHRHRWRVHRIVVRVGKLRQLAERVGKVECVRQLNHTITT
ncbi:putative Ig domain-containing protein [Rhodococcus erythropolis]|uniref:putative Ig domain-containing protein n=1 Tax=Rhodococcus erythropolis TaxID=1833 RepID=UPI00294965B4|nr:putative Ig domain-containing protein [Rhodococcus erythropolis]MDV6278279.1 putative Ig domain-containing protein [Rhodococcus erythropolis]